MEHAGILLCVSIAGLIAGWAIVITTDMFVLVDVTDADALLDPSAAQTHAEEPALSTWLAATILLAAELLSFGVFDRSEGLLSYLALLLVLFALFAIALLDLRWQLIPLDLFIPLALGSLGWVLLHPITIWLALISGGFAFGGMLLWLAHARRNHGDLFLAILVGLFAGSGVTSFHAALATADRLAIGICAAALAVLIYSFLMGPENPEGEPFAKQTTALGPVFLSAALFVVFLR